MKLKADLLLGLSVKLINSLTRSARTANRFGLSDAREPKCLSLKEGDVVRVRSKEQILQTLDNHMKLGGCYFMDGMWQFCGRELVVEKRVNYFFDESSQKIYRPHDVVLLRDARCNGRIPCHAYTCQRSCLCFWKEAWLEKNELVPKANPLDREEPSQSIQNSRRDSNTGDTGDMREGDLVRVRTRKEIEETLDAEDSLDGCLFMEQMWRFCGSEYCIASRVEHFFDENAYLMSECRDIYILNEVNCSGKIPDLPQPCDRSCRILWKGKWLKKISEPS